MTTRKIKSRVEIILKKYFNGDYPEDIRDLVQEWIASATDEEQKDASLRKIFNKMVKYDPKPDKLAFEILEGYHRKLGVTGRSPIVKRTPLHRRTFFRVAAALVPTLIVACWLIWNYYQTPEVESLTVLAHVDMPNMRGCRERATLNDGSDVFIRPGSLIRYVNESKEGGKRRMMLSQGEVYLNVAKDSLKPFVVETNHLNVNVLGTKFNVQTIPDSPHTIVTLYEGKITVEARTEEEGQIAFNMTPGQQLVYNNNTHQYAIEQIASTLPEWMAARLVFEEASYANVFHTIEWYYGMTVEVEGTFKHDGDLNFRFIGKEDIETAMRIFQSFSREFTYEISDKTVHVKVKH